MEELISVTAISNAIREEALRLGFTDCGFARAEAVPDDAERLRHWLDRGYHAGMEYMANYFEKRIDPTWLVKGARSVVSLLYNYYSDKLQHDPGAPILSKYAYGKDYHLVMKEKMSLLYDFINTNFGPVEGRSFVDSAPVLDRAWARQAGLGWIGKNSNLISRKAGSFVFIGELIIDLELEYNTLPEGDFCGSCTACIDACPTGAILPERTLDAARCISYQTIENKGSVPAELREKLSNRFFGCDICQDICPWNRKALLHGEPAFEPPEELLEMRADEWYNLERERYNRLFRHSPLQRVGYGKIRESISFLQPDPED
jgi:epoxyqueuosine reductase